jgi:hypothetical protein
MLAGFLLLGVQLAGRQAQPVRCRVRCSGRWASSAGPGLWHSVDLLSSMTCRAPPVRPATGRNSIKPDRLDV